MATLDISLQYACAGGGHLRVGAAEDGGPLAVFAVETDEIRGNMTRAEKDQLITLLVKWKLTGMTRAAARSTLQAGFTVTV